MENSIQKTIEYVQDFFAQEYSGHDFSHTMRVYNLATKIALEEGADVFLVQLAALLHDVDDYKISKKTHSTLQNAREHMFQLGLERKTIENVCTIISQVSFKGKDSCIPDTIEGKCVQDADRLDAIGAIGIARAFSYGGNHQRKMYDPSIKPVLNMDEKTYRNHVSTTINHFYEKLFLLVDQMNTTSAKKMAIHRHKVMEEYIQEFLLEWEGDL
ncbi:MAG: HD domain-containing protein [Bacillota bacterium]|nr:HD domain-containing protein [Bacillota bacterium]